MIEVKCTVEWKWSLNSVQLLENTSYMEGNYTWAVSTIATQSLHFYLLKIGWLIVAGKLAVCHCLVFDFAWLTDFWKLNYLDPFEDSVSNNIKKKNLIAVAITKQWKSQIFI